MRKKILLPFSVLFSLCVSGQYPLTGVYNQDFNLLANSGTAAILPDGWSIAESGAAADGFYTAGNGSGSAGDTYSFGAMSNTERSLGTLQSGTLNPVFGFYFTNNTGSTITRITVSFTGEQWRLGTTGRTDRLDFQFSLNANTISSGDWADLDFLDFIAPVNTGATGPLDGNAASGQTVITGTITGILIPPGNTCCFRWTDPDATGADDGLAIDEITISPGFSPPSDMHYRSAGSGSWNDLSVWEVSADLSNWLSATELPTFYSGSIRIRAGHTVTYNYFGTADQLTIESSGQLHHNGSRFTINDGTGDDLVIQNGGILALSSANNPPFFSGAAPSVLVKTGAILRIAAGGLTTLPGAGVHAANYIYEDAAVLENSYNGIGTNGVTYFPNVNQATIPVLRITQNISLSAGAAATTRVNGVFEANGNISFTAAGQKIFRNGIRGTGTISNTASCGLLVIDGTTAVLGGSGALNLSVSGGLQVGSATGTILSLLNDKTISGNLSLLPTATYIETGNYNLVVTGTVSGGSAGSYIRTGGTGGLQLNGLGSAGVLFPVGHSRYNPVWIENGSGHNWTVGVTDEIVADFPQNTNGAVLLTWQIRPSINPPAAGADITFQFDQALQTGGLFTTVPYNGEPVQAWHRTNGYWLAAAVPQPLVNTGGNLRTVKITGLTQFSPYGLARTSLPLPVNLLSFTAEPDGDGSVLLNWELTAFAPATTRFEVERSPDGIQYTTVYAVPGNERGTLYQWKDKQLLKGLNYYRLKTMGANGEYAYSRVVTFRNNKAGLVVSSFFPNPVSGEGKIRIISERDRLTRWMITDRTGRLWQTRFVFIKKGHQSVQVDLSALPAGMYQLQIREGKLLKVVSFIRQ
ncbi:MAG: T9SS type A sorting domain-containing protein [Sphingobacteriales bacterium]|nr:T9SS type A sorting domain-containing protein [Sphingobacteriales bacterium]